jgi:hypothetical protein
LIEDANEESSITEHSIIANAISGQSLIATAEAEDNNQPIELGAFNFIDNNSHNWFFSKAVITLLTTGYNDIIVIDPEPNQYGHPKTATKTFKAQKRSSDGNTIAADTTLTPPVSTTTSIQITSSTSGYNNSIINFWIQWQYRQKQINVDVSIVSWKCFSVQAIVGNGQS